MKFNRGIDIGKRKYDCCMVSWAGLCPTSGQSGRGASWKDKEGGRRQPVNRGVCGAANVAIRYGVRMKAAYGAACGRNAGKHAPAVAVAAHKWLS